MQSQLRSAGGGHLLICSSDLTHFQKDGSCVAKRSVRIIASEEFLPALVKWLPETLKVEQERSGEAGTWRNHQNCISCRIFPNSQQTVGGPVDNTFRNATHNCLASLAHRRSKKILKASSGSIHITFWALAGCKIYGIISACKATVRFANQYYYNMRPLHMNLPAVHAYTKQHEAN